MDLEKKRVHVFVDFNNCVCSIQPRLLIFRPVRGGICCLFISYRKLLLKNDTSNSNRRKISKTHIILSSIEKKTHNVSIKKIIFNNKISLNTCIYIHLYLSVYTYLLTFLNCSRHPSARNKKMLDATINFSPHVIINYFKFG